jgi:diguanylate cyclase (GGDEF)-like protein
MSQMRAGFRLADTSLNAFARLTSAKLIFQWKAATVYTILLGVVVLCLFLSVHRNPATFAPDHFQANIRIACILPFLIFCFLSIALQQLAPSGLMYSVVLLSTALTLWMGTTAADLFYGMVNGLGPEWLKTGLMILTSFGILLAVFSGTLIVYRAQQKEQATSDLDALTGLFNRTGLLYWYAKLPSGQPCTLVVFDLNQLKTINDVSGHGAGDAYIRAIGQTIKDGLSAFGQVGRWGGDEFVAVLPAVLEQKAIQAIEALLRTTPLGTNNLPAFAYGTATLNTGESLERSFAVADGRMYDRKERQRNNKTQHVREINAVEEVSKELELLRTSEALLASGLPLVASLLRFEGTFYMQRQGDTWVDTNLQVPSGLQVPITEGQTQTLDDGLAGRAYRTGMAIWSTDYSTESDASPDWIAAGLKTTLITPVRCLGEIVGFIYLCNFSTWRSITPQVRRMTDIIALRLGHILDLERTERDIRRTEQDVRATLEGGLLGLGAALEARDLETSGHTRRVVEHATLLGEALLLAPEYLATLRQGAYLHDIGKLVIPDAILLKPGKLTLDEWELMKTHARAGYDIARSIPTLSEGAIDIILHHHERWDGTGYPDALIGEDIPLSARIFSVCDVYDALTSNRPYKQAWSQEDAVAEIVKQSGRQFDPEVVRTFLAVTGQPGG